MHFSAQPYVLAVFTGILAIFPNYVATCLTNEQAVEQRQRELKASSYAGFLGKIDQQTSPRFNQLLRLGSMIENIATDSEIQFFENSAAQLLTNHDAHQLHWEFTSASAQLRLFGSQRVIEICNDIEKAILQNDYAIDWSLYPPETAPFHKNWGKTHEIGHAYAIEEKISADQRLMIATVVKLTEALIAQQRLELTLNHPTRRSPTAAYNTVL